MLSICIPIFNFNIAQLVQKLYQQADNLNITFEIICIDDCSNEEFRMHNKLEANKYGTYIQLEQNIGRARIRNLFLKHTQYEYLLFLDCDSDIISLNFIQLYVNKTKWGYNQVICGGHIYSSKPPKRRNRLRWYYGNKRESVKAEDRVKNSSKYFKTCNFLINRSVFDKVQFNEKLTNYGHEDTLFGFQLQQNGIAVTQFDNPVYYDDVEDNEQFMRKTETGLKSLLQILSYVENDSSFIESIPILSFYERCKTKNLLWLLLIMYFISKPFISKLLTTGFVFLPLFDFYKLGYLINLKRKY